ncbi:MAG: carboxylesterase/lipase family protein [Ruminococcus sp.]|jgi:para-nitrobenzyl esterase
MKKKRLWEKTLCIILSSAMVLSLAACSRKNSGEISQRENDQEEAENSYGTVTEEKPIVETKYGKVQGRTEDGVAGFRNIPYGSNVDGEGRFLPAEEPESWSDVKDCTITGPRAVQTVGLSGHGNLFQTRVGDYFAGGRIGELGLNDQMDSENCLNLNVLTPGIDDKKRPVMVYIHGGAFVEGSNAITAGAYGLPRDEDVVLVGVNHRLNGFGFLYLGDLNEKYAESGNVGLLDLVLALEWVRDNIEAFGGDPDNVTIFGESGGGAKVLSLTMMEKADGLFHKAIIQSGTYRAFKTKEDAAENTKICLEKLGISENELDRLAEIPTDELFEAMGTDYGPVLDGINLSEDIYEANVSDNILQISDDIPMLIGTDADEMKWLSGEGNRDLFRLEDADLAEMLETDLGENTDKIIDGYKEAYPEYSASDLYFKITTDNTFGKNAYYLSDLKADANEAPVYRYLYNHICPIEDGLYGAYHTAELPLIMRMVMYEEDENMSKTLASMWANFARTGDPSTEDISWPAYTTDDRQVMILEEESHVQSDPEQATRELWNEVDGRG